MSEGKANKQWNDEELRAALDAYLYMLQLELSSVPFSAEKYSQLLRSGPLEERSPASVRYRMRNISAVVAGQNLPVIVAFSPAEQVGRNVRAKIEQMLDDRKETLESIKRLNSFSPSPASVEDVLRNLDDLKTRLSKMEEEKPVGIGHNNPPGDFEYPFEEIRSANDAVDAIKVEIISGKPDLNRVSTLSQILSSLALKALTWTGQRITDFSKAAAVTAGSGFGVYASGLSEHVLAALRALFQLFS